MSRPMKNELKISFEHDRANDVIIATPRGTVATPGDVTAWCAQHEAFARRFERKMDFVVVLDEFELGPGIGVLWGEARARFARDYARFHYRVRSNKRVQLFVNTSGVRYSIATDEVATVADAIAAIKEARLRVKSA